MCVFKKVNTLCVVLKVIHMQYHAIYEYNGTLIRVRGDGYWCVTDMCHAFDKRIEEYFSVHTVALANAIDDVNGTPTMDAIDCVKYVNDNTTDVATTERYDVWTHHIIAMHLAIWLAPTFGVIFIQWCDEYKLQTQIQACVSKLNTIYNMNSDDDMYVSPTSRLEHLIHSVDMYVDAMVSINLYKLKAFVDTLMGIHLDVYVQLEQPMLKCSTSCVPNTDTHALATLNVSVVSWVHDEHLLDINIYVLSTHKRFTYLYVVDYDDERWAFVTKLSEVMDVPIYQLLDADVPSICFQCNPKIALLYKAASC